MWQLNVAFIQYIIKTDYLFPLNDYANSIIEILPIKWL
jgi:hypothetical protein